MKKNKKLYTLMFIVFSISLCFFAQEDVYANSKDEYPIEVCIKENFEKEILSPGDSDKLKFSIKNDGNKKIKIKKLYFSYHDKVLEDKFNILSKNTDLTIKYENNVIISCTLNKLLSEANDMKLDIEIKPHESIDFDMNIDIDKSLGNEVQNIYQELFINTEYQIYNIDGNVLDGNKNDNNNNNNNNIEEDVAQPNTGSTNNYEFYMIVGILSISVIGFVLYVNRKKHVE